MQEVVAREELEKNLMQLSAHGFDPEKINEIRRNFEKQFKKTEKFVKESGITLLRLTGIKGFKYGKKSKTKVINRP